MCFWAIFYLKSSEVQCSVGRLFRRIHRLNQVNMLVVSACQLLPVTESRRTVEFIHYRVADIA